jgi:DNA-binding MarR family transcriptional regulator
MAIPPTGAPTKDAEVDFAGRTRTVIGQLGRRLRLTHSDRDLSPSQHEVLGTIVRRGPLRLSELSAIEGLNPTTLSRVAGKLDARGLVTRTQDPHDGRVAHLDATQVGRELYDAIRSKRTDALRLAFRQLSEDERRTLTEALPVLESLAEALKRQPR